jgi:hypothetical protein
VIILRVSACTFQVPDSRGRSKESQVISDPVSNKEILFCQMEIESKVGDRRNSI